MRIRRRRTALSGSGAVLAALLLAVTATACGSSDGDRPADAGGSRETAPPKKPSKDKPGLGGVKLPSSVPTSVDDLKNFKWDDWSDWGKQNAFKNPRVEGLWSPERMRKALAADLSLKNASAGKGGAAEPGTSPIPKQVKAVERKPPYNAGRTAMLGKVFFDSPEGPRVCSGTVVADPAHPGKSNLVWTAGHCVHGGKGGGWYRNVQFVPAYNNNGRAYDGVNLSDRAVAPYGQWWSSWVQTSSEWAAGGSTKEGNAASHYDFGVMRVQQPQGTGKSLEETVGGALPVWFNAPRQRQITAWGYPAASPFHGQKMFHCEDGPVRLALDAQAPAMPWIGCSMTGGSSGGGWFGQKKSGKWALVGNNSIGDANHTWLASPYLGDTAKAVYQAIVRHRG